jgi:L-threonylcarbamoyladenylate synthase
MSDNTEELIEKTVEVLKRGGLILYPTDTVWGIGCDASNFEAVEKINKLKKREAGKSFIVLIDDDRKLNRYVRNVPDVAWDIVEFSEKPTTIIYPQAYNLANNVFAEDFSLGIRVVKKGLCHDLLRKYGKPLISTSANLSNSPTPKSLKDIDPTILEGVDYVLNLPEGNKLKGKPSKIIKLKLNGEITFIRE